ISASTLAGAAAKRERIASAAARRNTIPLFGIVSPRYRASFRSRHRWRQIEPRNATTDRAFGSLTKSYLAEPRRPFLQERRDRLLVLRALPALAEHLALARLHAVEVGFRRVLREEPLDHAELRVRVRGDVARERDRLVKE